MKKFTRVEFQGMPCVERRVSTEDGVVPHVGTVVKMQPMMGLKESGSRERWVMWCLAIGRTPRGTQTEGEAA